MGQLWASVDLRGVSKCGASRFGSIAERFFGHSEHQHQLLTRPEQALEQRGIRVGDKVAFEHQGREWLGKVNRVTKRATVLVEDPAGTRYSNGKRYTKFYVPTNLVAPVARA